MNVKVIVHVKEMCSLNRTLDRIKRMAVKHENVEFTISVSDVYKEVPGTTEDTEDKSSSV